MDKAEKRGIVIDSIDIYYLIPVDGHMCKMLWLNAKNIAFDSQKPIDLIISGESNRVIDYLNGFHS